MIEVGLFDGSFTHQLSASLGGENTCEGSQVIQWVHNDYRPVTFFTDMHIGSVVDAPDDITKVAWLIEPPSLSDTHYKRTIELQEYFDCVLTFHKEFMQELPKIALYYPYGGSWIPIQQFGLFPKSNLLSIIGTDKQRAEGHKLRNFATSLLVGSFQPVYGRGTGNPIESKIEALRPYCYSIVIESTRVRGYFSEKLIDCLSQGTVPIYWGDPDVGELFDISGMIVLNTEMDLLNIINSQIGYQDYLARLSAIQYNLKRCQRYRCAEDWIYRSYPYIFEPCEKNVKISL